MEYYFDAFKQYAVFSGRATRTQYWMFVLVNFIVSVVVMAISALLASAVQRSLGSLQWVYFIAVFIPSLALMVRRLHDTNRSGWWVLINAVPFIGALVLLFFMVQASTPGANDYDVQGENQTVLN